MKFASDNNGPVHPKIMEAIVAANDGSAPAYGNDALSAAALEKVREVFEAPEAAVFLVPTGTAANSLLLASMVRPWDAIFASRFSHINVDECHAPEAFSGGAKIVPVGSDIDKFNNLELTEAISAFDPSNLQQSGRGPVSVTQVTERGRMYSLNELSSLTKVAREFGVPVHLDGARFANACAALGVGAAEMSWRAGIDAVSFGATKNGAMAVEAAIIFDAARAEEFRRRQQRAAMVFSKSRFLAAQMLAYLTDDLWLNMAGQANANSARLEAGLAEIEDVSFEFERQANMIFFRMPRFRHQAAMDAGGYYYIEEGQLEGDNPQEMLLGRLVCDWSVEGSAIDRFVTVLKDARP